MTRLERRNYGRGHGYKVDGEKVLGVTTILNAISKPALTNWAARKAADEAVNHWEELGGLPMMERHERIASAHRNYTQERALRGTEIHSLGEKLSHGIQVDVPDDRRGPVEAYARFLDRWEIDMVSTEWPCASVSRRHAGTGDGLAKFGKTLPDADPGQLVLLDLKSGKSVYSEAALQLAAYRYSEIWQPEKGREEPMPEVAAVYVAHILDDDVRLLPITADERIYRHFLYVQQTAFLMDEIKQAPLVGDQLTLAQL